MFGMDAAPGPWEGPWGAQLCDVFFCVMVAAGKLLGWCWYRQPPAALQR